MSATTRIKMIQKGLVLITLMIAYTAVVSAYPPIIYAKPEQIHLATGSTSQQMIVTWSVHDQTNQSFILYGTDGKTNIRASANVTKRVDEGKSKNTQYISKVVLDNLEPGEVYTYVVANEYVVSEKFEFQAQKSGDWNPRLCIYGDLGNVNGQSIPQITLEVEQGMYDAVIHAGDIAYNMLEEDGQMGDVFMNMIQPIAASVPYMVCPGNHEVSYNFSHYRSKFNMPNDEGSKNLYFSYNMGPLHIISLNTMYYYTNELPYVGAQQTYNQYNWLIQDLKEANKPENRAERPWIFVFGHIPPYCTNIWGGVKNCSNAGYQIREGIPPHNDCGLDDVLYDYGVDVAIWAHQHSYERLFPLYKFQMMNGSYEEPYTNPQAPVHIITGSAGDREIQTLFLDDPPTWSAFRTMDYGYTRMNTMNKTHLYFEQVSINQGGKVIDSFNLIKDSHGPYDKTGKKRSREFTQEEIEQRIKGVPKFRVV